MSEQIETPTDTTEAKSNPEKDTVTVLRVNEIGCRVRPGEGAVVTTRHEHLLGLMVCVVDGCGAPVGVRHWCGCTVCRVAPHSKVSNVLVWKCVRCGKRHGRLTDDDIEELDSFYDRHGKNRQPLQWCETFGGYFERGWHD
jgi:hypothetical protein